jgi:hypothetical protein
MLYIYIPTDMEICAHISIPKYVQILKSQWFFTIDSSTMEFSPIHAMAQVDFSGLRSKLQKTSERMVLQQLENQRCWGPVRPVVGIDDTWNIG